MTTLLCASVLLTASANASTVDPKACEKGYPLMASQQNLEGYVRLKFDINTEGKPVNIKVLKSNPEKIFDEHARCSLSKWEYKPKVIDGIAVKQVGLEVQLDYKM